MRRIKPRDGGPFLLSEMRNDAAEEHQRLASFSNARNSATFAR